MSETDNRGGALPTTDDARWRAVTTRARSADGGFYYAVRTTGVYCRPSCSARTPRRENVVYFESTTDAEVAGFRACKRCRPGAASASEIDATLVARACRLIEAADTPPTLQELASETGSKPARLQRVFTRVTGVTPNRYASHVRARRLRERLSEGDSVTDAICRAGFGSASRFYEKADETLGMTAGEFRSGGKDNVIRFAIGDSSFGPVLVAATDRGVCAILMDDDREVLVADLNRRFPRAELIAGDPDFESLVASVIAFIEEPCLGLDLPLDVRGTAFQQRVWDALRRIPAGRTASYSEVAEMIGSPSSTRAVAAACAANSIAVAIPCHRVVRSDGGLSGYRWGVERKRELLGREGTCATGDEPGETASRQQDA